MCKEWKHSIVFLMGPDEIWDFLDLNNSNFNSTLKWIELEY